MANDGWGNLGKGIGALLGQNRARKRAEEEEKKRRERIRALARMRGVTDDELLSMADMDAGVDDIVKADRERKDVAERDAAAAKATIEEGRKIAPFLENASLSAQMESTGSSGQGPERRANIEQAAGMTNRDPRQVFEDARKRTAEMEKEREQKEFKQEVGRGALPPTVGFYVKAGKPVDEAYRLAGMMPPERPEKKEKPTLAQRTSEGLKIEQLQSEIDWEKTGRKKAQDEIISEIGPRPASGFKIDPSSGLYIDPKEAQDDYDRRFKTSFESKKNVFLKERDLDAVMQQGYTAGGEAGGEEESYYRAILDDLNRQLQDLQRELSGGR